MRIRTYIDIKHNWCILKIHENNVQKEASKREINTKFSRWKSQAKVANVVLIENACYGFERTESQKVTRTNSRKSC